MAAAVSCALEGVSGLWELSMLDLETGGGGLFTTRFCVHRDPTYAVARAMAAPVLHAQDTSSCGGLGTSARSGNGRTADTSDKAAVDDTDSPRSTYSDSSSGLDTPVEGNRSEPLPHQSLRNESSYFPDVG